MFEKFVGIATRDLMLLSPSASFYSALAFSQKVRSTASLFFDGELVAENLPVTGGSVDFDRTRGTRRTTQGIEVVSIDGDGRSLVPTSVRDRLAPYGAEVVLNRGIELDGQMKLAPLGYLRISEVEVVNERNFVTIGLTAYDRSRTISRARFIDTWVAINGTSYLTAMQDIVNYALPGTEIIVEGEVVTSTTPLLVYEGQSDPWEILTKMATSIGSEIFFKPDGTLVVRPEPDPHADSAIDRGFVIGEETCRLLKVSKQLSDSPGYNGVVVVGNPPNLAPVRAVYWDEAEGSPTHYLGPYGKVPMFYTSEYITTEEQAYAAARALFLRECRGRTERLAYEAIVNPLADASDIVPVSDPKLGVSSNYLHESGTVPLTANGSSGGVLTRRWLAAA